MSKQEPPHYECDKMFVNQLGGFTDQQLLNKNAMLFVHDGRAKVDVTMA